MTKAQENKITKFIKENSLNLNETGSGLNSVCCILAGYILYLGIPLYEVIEYIGEDSEIDVSLDFATEFERVYEYADSHDYGDWWKKPEAKTQYKF